MGWLGSLPSSFVAAKPVPTLTLLGLCCSETRERSPQAVSQILAGAEHLRGIWAAQRRLLQPNTRPLNRHHMIPLLWSDEILYFRQVQAAGGLRI